MVSVSEFEYATGFFFLRSYECAGFTGIHGLLTL
jgi:hypothetical protein